MDTQTKQYVLYGFCTGLIVQNQNSVHKRITKCSKRQTHTHTHRDWKDKQKSYTYNIDFIFV